MRNPHSPSITTGSITRRPELPTGRAAPQPAATQETLAPASERPTARDDDTTASSPHDTIFLTVAEVATVMRVSKMTVYRLIHTGHLAAIRVGRTFRVPERTVHVYLRTSWGTFEPAPASDLTPPDEALKEATIADACGLLQKVTRPAKPLTDEPSLPDTTQGCACSRR
jgi:excisionase family DNA binding protein